MSRRTVVPVASCLALLVLALLGFTFHRDLVFLAAELGFQGSEPITRFTLPEAAPVESGPMAGLASNMSQQHSSTAADPEGNPDIPATTGVAALSTAAVKTGAKKLPRDDTLDQNQVRPAKVPDVSGGVQLRAAAHLESRRLAILPSGTEIIVMERAGRWARVRTTTGKEGFVHGRFVDLSAQPNAALVPDSTKTGSQISGLMVR